VDDEVFQAALERMHRDEDRSDRGYQPLCDPPLINLAWLADDAYEDEAMELEDVYAEAWDRVRRDPGWSAWVQWYDRHLPLLTGRNMANIEDRAELRFRRVRDGQFMYVPIDMLRAANDVSEVMQQLVAAFFERRAAALGLAPAPRRPLGRSFHAPGAC
jgi:hypothetical protein